MSNTMPIGKKDEETQTYQNGLSKTCRYRDNSMNPVCYFGGKAVYIKSCVGCHEDGRNAKMGADATAFAERGEKGKEHILCGEGC